MAKKKAKKSVKRRKSSRAGGMKGLGMSIVGALIPSFASGVVQRFAPVGSNAATAIAAGVVYAASRYTRVIPRGVGEGAVIGAAAAISTSVASGRGILSFPQAVQTPRRLAPATSGGLSYPQPVAARSRMGGGLRRAF